MLHKIAIIGAGTMGSGIAQVCACNGLSVILIDTFSDQLSRAKAGMEKSLAKLVEKNVLNTEQMRAALHNISFSEHLEDAKDAQAVIEAIVEREDKKKELLRALENICKPSAIFGSNTSSISITVLSSALRSPERFMGVHFFNPVPLMKLVELVKGKHTSEETFTKFHGLTLQLQKDPAIVNDFPGFVSNRILMPMINEAILALEQGVASKEDIDKVMRLGMAHPMGPLTLADLIGLDVCLDIMNVLYRDFKDTKYRPAKMLEDKVKKGELGRKSKKGFYEYPSK